MLAEVGLRLASWTFTTLLMIQYSDWSVTEGSGSKLPSWGQATRTYCALPIQVLSG